MGAWGGTSNSSPSSVGSMGDRTTPRLQARLWPFCPDRALVFPSAKHSVSPCLSQNRVGTNVRSNKVKGKSALTSPGLSLQ